MRQLLKLCPKVPHGPLKTHLSKEGGNRQEILPRREGSYCVHDQTLSWPRLIREREAPAGPSLSLPVSWTLRFRPCQQPHAFLLHLPPRRHSPGDSVAGPQARGLAPWSEGAPSPEPSPLTAGDVHRLPGRSLDYLALWVWVQLRSLSLGNLVHLFKSLFHHL